jgi:glycosyltransferase involved in cell wall biosynthesis
MRVSLVTETYFPQVNGVSRTLGELVRHLTECGDLIQLIHPNYGEPAGRPDIHLVRSVNVPFYKELYLPLPPFGSVRRAMTAFRPDIVHIATEATLGLSVLRHVLARKIATVSSFHTNFDQYTHHYRLGWAEGPIWRYLRWFHNRTRETYVPSMTTIKSLKTLGFERLVLWPRGVDATLFRPDRPGRQQVRQAMGWGPDDVVISYVSRIAPEKNVSYLAEALGIVAAKRPDARVLFVGDGPAREDLQRWLGGIAKFAGYRMGQDLADHYAAGDIFAFSSLTETFGNVVLEAMASGMPVVAVRAGGVGDTIQHGTTGLLVEQDDPPARFAGAVLSLVEDAEKRRAMSGAARAYALDQSWSAIMGQLRERYLQAIDSGQTTATGGWLGHRQGGRTERKNTW